MVKQTFQQSVGGRNVTIQEIEAPELPLVVPEKEDEQLLAPEDNPWLKNTPAVQPMRVIAVSSTIYGTGANKVTRITLHYQGDSYHAWSNIDFRHMQGFSAYKANGREYFILLGAGLARDDQGKIMSINAAYAEGCPSQLTTLGKEVAFIYVPDSEPQSNVKLNQAREILEDMHTLYGKEKVKLAAAYESRVQLAVMNTARAEEIRNTPPGDATIRFWKRDMVKEQQERGAE
ncbi:hypothetical protein JIN77_00265 [Verrucomicrobiaceae bacterium R5-34]|nr:hypothetical protein [Verrucomicrobiaceae bacterium R5-34]